jgi:hypothetical protein
MLVRCGSRGGGREEGGNKEVLQSTTSNLSIDIWVGWDTSLAEDNWSDLTLLGKGNHWGLSSPLATYTQPIHPSHLRMVGTHGQNLNEQSAHKSNSNGLNVELHVDG